jgi:competence protein ComEC
MIQHNQQNKLIIYNIPQHSAIDIIEGNHYTFLGDSELRQDAFLKNFNLKPSRILNRISETDHLNSAILKNDLIQSAHKSIFILNKPVTSPAPTQKISVDVILLSKNPKVYIWQLESVFDCKEIVFDSNNPYWKIEKWKKDCDSLHLRFHSVPEKGAFEIEL